MQGRTAVIMKRNKNREPENRLPVFLSIPDIADFLQYTTNFSFCKAGKRRTSFEVRQF